MSNYIRQAACILPCLFSLAAATYAQGWIVLPVNEYRALRQRAYPAEREAPSLPAEAALTRVEYDLRIEGHLASGHAALTIDVLNEGWVKVPLPAGLFVKAATSEGKAVSLVPAAGNQLSVLLSKRGRSVIALELVLPVSATMGNEALILPTAGNGITRASITLPKQELDVRTAGGIIKEKSETATESKWVAYGAGGESLSFYWHRKIEERRITLPLRFRGKLTQLAGLGEDSTSISAEVEIEVTQGAGQRIDIQIPPNVTVNQVQGSAVANWETKAGELQVSFLDPVEKSTRFTISGEAKLPREGAVEIPLLRLSGAERDSGGVAIEVLGAGEIKDLKSQGLERTDANELGAYISNRQSPSLTAFRFRAVGGAPRSLSVQVARYQQQAVLLANIEEARYRVLMSQDGKTLVEARYAVRNNQRNFVKVTPPAGATLWSASMEGRPVKPGQSPDGGYLFALSKTRAGDDSPVSVVELLYLARTTPWGEKGRASFKPPPVDLPISKTGILIYYPPLFKLTAEAGAFRAQEYEQPSAAMAIAPGERIGDWSSSANSNGAAQMLIDKYRSRPAGRGVAVAIPIHVSFPAVGPTIFLVSELTSENQAATVDLNYQKEKKGGVK